MQLPTVVMSAARDCAAARGCSYVGTEHVLVALFSLKPGPAARALIICGASEAAIVSKMDSLLAQPGSSLARDDLPHVPRVKWALERAANEAIARGHISPTPEHLLLALMSDEETVATQLLLNLGVDLYELAAKVSKEAGWSS
jgi:ATP-dependent Clp protease ATP-binding subunit ClpC